MNENDKHEAFEAIVQAELYREVVDIYAEPENFPREEASEHAEKILRLIDEAVAARDAEIREALLSDEAVERYVASVKAAMNLEEPEPTDEDSARLAAKFWLDAIGLHGDGTGGQG